MRFQTVLVKSETSGCTSNKGEKSEISSCTGNQGEKIEISSCTGNQGDKSEISGCMGNQGDKNETSGCAGNQGLSVVPFVLRKGGQCGFGLKTREKITSTLTQHDMTGAVVLWLVSCADKPLTQATAGLTPSRGRVMELHFSPKVLARGNKTSIMIMSIAFGWSEERHDWAITPPPILFIFLLLSLSISCVHVYDRGSQYIRNVFIMIMKQSKTIIPHANTDLFLLSAVM